MQELKLILAESDQASLVLRGVASGEEFFLPVTRELVSLLSDANPVDSADLEPAAPEDSVSLRSLSAVSDAPQTSDDAPSEAEPEGAPQAADESADADSPAPAETATVSALGAVPDADNSSASAPEEPVRADWSNSGVMAKGDVEKKRRYRSRINMSPRAIQDRVRHGASIAELAQEADTDESRIEPYAWPILQERARIAELAHSAHPVSGDGPSKQKLWEVLATALAARGTTVSDTEWVAYQDPSRRWVIAVRWTKEAAGQTTAHEAEFLFEQATAGPSLAHPLNSVASDLIDPRYGQPVRRISAVAPLLGDDSADDDYSEYDEYDDHGNQLSGADSADEGSPADELEGDHFLLHPADDNDDRKTKRKRKAVTPHWEDVLLGVRTNPRKKK